MRSIARYPVVVTSGANGAGTAQSIPISGEVLEVRIPNGGTALFAGGTADLTITRGEDGGTILSEANIAIPYQRHPRAAVHTTAGGTTAYALGIGPVVDAGGGIPVDSHINVVVADGAASKAGTIYLHVRE